ncbi:hypothetical protein B0F90DRAFT_1688817 [Multifurca ochricompacta]|uniref:Mitochondrial outer membrane transport complex Sam37/metaxin N-terminal domain-containing protein n=1 Tax=Multifurca ochricompacta TaxID=376703 RepID=A0AAD4MB09_9AGAM|nr:hypothetical protein B0F90DRAFT_1688817 [Multifurca ochricompacta]
MNPSTQGLTLHLWPSKWNLPSIEPSCIVAAFYLQLALPGRFSIQECTNPDLSPSGQLPYLTHGHHTVAPLSSILKYVAALTPASISPVTGPDAPEPGFSADVDVLLDPSDRALRTAWIAHAESALGDLVAYVFYSIPANYAAITHPTLSSFYKVPQSYYVPKRICQAHQARLQANGLWNTPGKRLRQKTPSALTRKKRKRIQSRYIKAHFSASGLLGDKNFFFYDRPTTLDLVLAAHILLLVHAPLPDTLLSSLLSSSYPTLLSHARRVLAAATPTVPVHPPERYRLSALLPYPSFHTWWSEPRPPKSEEEKRFERMRWRWIGLAILGSVGYWFIWGPKLRFVKVENGDGDENLAIVVGGETVGLDIGDEADDGVEEEVDDNANA